METKTMTDGIAGLALPDHARVWIFQAERFLTDEETARLDEAGNRFADQWKAHGKELTAQFATLSNLFAVMAIDERMEGASGCSIDTFMRFIQDAEKDLGVRFTNRLVFAYVHDGQIRIARNTEAKQLAASGTLAADTPVFDNLVPDLEKLRKEWLKPASALWVATYLK